MAEIEEETKRKGSPLLSTAKHQKFDNVTIRKKKKIFVSRHGVVGALVPSPQKTEEDEDEVEDDNSNDDNHEVREDDSVVTASSVTAAERQSRHDVTPGHGRVGKKITNNLLSCRPRNDGPYDVPMIPSTLHRAPSTGARPVTQPDNT